MQASARFRRSFIRLGVLNSTLIVTAISIAMSLLITLVAVSLSAAVAAQSIVLAAIVPAIIAPIMSVLFLRIIIQLDEAEEQLRKLAITDELTGVYNRRYFLELARRELERAHRFGKPFSAILLDVDNFKRANDDYGHSAGDSVLRVVAATCLRHCRKIDTFARHGGDEFVFLLPECSIEEAIAFAERIRMAIEEIRFDYLGNHIQITLSLGVQVYSGEDETLESIMLRADQALYDAKETGKNRVSTVALSK